MDSHEFQSLSAVLDNSEKTTKMTEVITLIGRLTAGPRKLLVFVRTKPTNARKEAANLTAKKLKRIGRGYRNHGHYRLRTLQCLSSRNQDLSNIR